MLLFVLCAWLVDAEILDSITSKPVEPWYPREFVFAPVEVISTPVYDRNSEQEEHILSLKRTDMFIGRRRRRAVKKPSPNALDDQAAAAIFGDEGKWDHKPKHRESPPAPPDPVLYNRQFPVKPSGIQRESQHGSREYDTFPLELGKDRLLPKWRRRFNEDLNLRRKIPHLPAQQLILKFLSE
ncbi:unnamed protein product [Cylicostephanus goldi]|uniref:Uncharacterized protein n=1 Tax=Cylicostephanus goldi TaxID=71465 RepID=A0A3P6RAJ4_CYLGO|nr:unnamed protein product [Cylicostephanus goldi]